MILCPDMLLLPLQSLYFDMYFDVVAVVRLVRVIEEIHHGKFIWDVDASH